MTWVPRFDGSYLNLDKFTKVYAEWIWFDDQCIGFRIVAEGHDMPLHVVGVFDKSVERCAKLAQYIRGSYSLEAPHGDIWLLVNIALREKGELERTSGTVFDLKNEDEKGKVFQTNADKIEAAIYSDRLRYGGDGEW